MRCYAILRSRVTLATPRTIDIHYGKTHLTAMSVEISISSKGQIVIPKDVRDALQLKAGEKLMLSRVGRRIVLDAPDLPRETISYDEFRRCVPRYDGPPVAIDDMTVDFDQLGRDTRRNDA